MGPHVVRSLAQVRPRVCRGGSPRLGRSLWPSLCTSRSPRICVARSSQANCPGAHLKTEVEPREEYRQDGREVSRNTVRDAIKLLVSRGMVETRPGQGTFGGKWSRLSPVLAGDLESGGEADVYKSEVERQGRMPQETDSRVEVQLATGDVVGS